MLRARIRSRPVGALIMPATVVTRSVFFFCLLILSQTLQALGSENTFGMPRVLPPEEAMQVSATADAAGERIQVLFVLAPEVYLYHHALDFRLTDTSGNVLEDFASFTPPPGELKNDEIFGEVAVSWEFLQLSLPLAAIPLAPARLEVSYQGCLDNVLCYAPQMASLPLTFTPGSGDNSRQMVTATAPPRQGFLETLWSEDANAFSNWLKNQSLVMALTLFFIGGLLLAFTPCVFPMVPILSGIIAGQQQPTALRGFLLSSAYVLGMAIPYTAAGLLVALLGAGVNLTYWLQQPAAILVSVMFFILLALAMFDVITLQMPEALRERLQSAEKGRGGSLGGTAIMGAISALVVSPCVTPILAGALVYVASTGNATTGALSLFCLALGMGVPLIAWGTGGSHLLPRAGNWMNDIKRFFGIVMIGVAIWLLDRIIPDPLTLALYGLLLCTYGIILGALQPAREDHSRLRRGLALALALYGVVMVVGAIQGGDDPLQPLARSSHPADAPATDSITRDASGFVSLIGQPALDRIMQEAAVAGQPVLVDFFAEWCVACKVLEETTLRDAEVLAAMAQHDMLLVRVDITEVSRDNRNIMQDYSIIGLPSLLFFDRSGAEIPDARVLGEMGAESFLQHLETRVFSAL